MYQYILFDLDGTLTDPKVGICTCVQYALKDAGIEESNLDVLEPFIGPPLKDSFQEFYHMNEEQSIRAIEKYRERFRTVGLYENEIYPGIADMLKRLHENGKKLGIASSKPTVFVEKILLHFHILQYFDVVVGSELDGTRGKKEEVLEEALHQLIPEGRATYDTCVMVGDRRFDVEGAIAHGIDSIGVTYGYGGTEELQDAGVTYLADSVQELEKLLNISQNHNLGYKKIPEDSKENGAGKAGRHLQEQYKMNSFFKAWQILFPILLYWTICNIILVVGVVFVQMYLGTQNNVTDILGEKVITQISAALNALAMLGTISFMYRMYRSDNPRKMVRNTDRITRSTVEDVLNKKQKSVSGFVWSKVEMITILLVGILGVSSALTFNMVLSYIHFDSVSDSYNSVSQMQYSISIPLGVLIYGLISPAAEELVFRGLVMKRLQRYFSPVIAVVVSAFIFGMYHGNIVQGVYAFLLGTLIAVCYWHFDRLYIPIVFHACANVSVFIITYHRGVESMINKPLNCVIFAIISVLTFLELMKLKKREKI